MSRIINNSLVSTIAFFALLGGAISVGMFAGWATATYHSMRFHSVEAATVLPVAQPLPPPPVLPDMHPAAGLGVGSVGFQDLTDDDEGSPEDFLRVLSERVADRASSYMEVVITVQERHEAKVIRSRYTTEGLANGMAADIAITAAREVASRRFNVPQESGTYIGDEDMVSIHILVKHGDRKIAERTTYICRGYHGEEDLVGVSQPGIDDLVYEIVLVVTQARDTAISLYEIVQDEIKTLASEASEAEQRLSVR